MELTPKVFRDVQFREKLRGGYHPEDVDEFLEQAAAATEALLDRLRQANERAQRAEAAATDAAATDEALKRMLLMAQRTADQAVREARDEAERLVAQARRQAEALIVDAEERGRRAYESGIGEGRATLGRLDEAARQRQRDVEALQGWVELHKAHLLAVLRDAEALVESAGLVSQPPSVGAGAFVAEGTPAPGQASLAASAVRDDDGTAPVLSDELSGGTPAGQPVAGYGDAGDLAAKEDVGPNGGDTAAAPADNRFGGPTGSVEEAGSARQDGDKWDPRYVDDLQAGAHGSDRATGVPAHAAPGYSVAEGAPDAAPAPAGAAPAGAAPGDESSDTMAFDERALDSFFSDQDLGDERGLGRFRRRQ